MCFSFAFLIPVLLPKTADFSQSKFLPKCVDRKFQRSKTEAEKESAFRAVKVTGLRHLARRAG